MRYSPPPPAPPPPRGPWGLAATPRSWIAVPGPSSVVPRYGRTDRSRSRRAGMLSQARRGLPSLTTGGRGALGWRGCVAERSSDLGTRDGCALLEVIALG